MRTRSRHAGARPDASRALALFALWLPLGAAHTPHALAAAADPLARAAESAAPAASPATDSLYAAKQAWDELVSSTYDSLLRRIQDREDVATRELADPNTLGGARSAAQQSLARLREGRERLIQLGEWPAALDDSTELAQRLEAARARVDAAYERAIELARVDEDPDQHKRLAQGRELFAALRSLSPWSAMSGVRKGSAMFTPHVSWSPIELHQPLPDAFLLRATVTRSEGRGGLKLRLGNGEDPPRLIHLPPDLLAASQADEDAEPALHHLRILFLAGAASVELEGQEVWFDAIDSGGAPPMEAIEQIALGTADSGTRVELAQCELRRLWPSAKKKAKEPPAPKPELEPEPEPEPEPAAEPALAPARALRDGAVTPTPKCVAALLPVNTATLEFEAKLDTLSRDVLAALEAALREAATPEISIPQLEAVKEQTRAQRQLFECRARMPARVPMQLQADIEKAVFQQHLLVLAAYEKAIKSCDPAADAACIAGLKDALADFKASEHLAPWWSDAQLRALVTIGSDSRSWKRAGSGWLGPGLLSADGARTPFVLSGELPLEFVCEAQLSLSSEARSGLAISLAGAFGSWEIPLAGAQLDACLPKLPAGQACSIALRITLKRSRVTIEVERQRVWCEAVASTPASAGGETPTAGVTIALRGAEPSARFGVDGLRLKAIRTKGAVPAPPSAGAIAPPVPPAPSKASAREPEPRDANKAAVLAGLGWLLRHQGADGSWAALKLDDLCADGDPCWPPTLDTSGELIQRTPHYDEGLTSLALLAILGAGHAPDSTLELAGEAGAPPRAIGAAIQRALAWLASRQNADGSVTPQHAFLYNEALAAAAFCEAYAASGKQQWKEPAQRAIDCLVAAQKLRPGGDGPWGWRYAARNDIEEQKARGKLDEAQYASALHESDTSVTTWCVEALVSARRAGLRVPKQSLDGASEFLRWVTPHVPAAQPAGKSGNARSADLYPGTVGYLEPAGANQDLLGLRFGMFHYYHESLSALGMCARFAIDGERSDPFLRAASARLVKRLPSAEDKRDVDYYYWYHGTLALNRYDRPVAGDESRGQLSRPWNDALAKALARLQVDQDPKRHCHRGGWIQLDRWAYAGGPIYTTAISLLALEATLSTPVAAQGEERGSEAAAAPR